MQLCGVGEDIYSIYTISFSPILYDSLQYWENFPTLPRSYAGHAEIKYLVANFHLQRRARGQGGESSPATFIGRFIFRKQVMAAVTLQNAQKLATAKYEDFVSPGCAMFLKRLIPGAHQ